MDHFPEDLYAWTAALRGQATALRCQARELCSTSVEQRLVHDDEAHRHDEEWVEWRTVPAVTSNGDALRASAREVRSRSVELRIASALARDGRRRA